MYILTSKREFVKKKTNIFSKYLKLLTIEQKFTIINMIEKRVKELELKEIKAIGPSTEKALHKLGINVAEDLITFYPFRYDIMKRSDILNASTDDKIIIDGIIESIPNIFYIHKNLNKMSFKLQTEKLLLQVIIFNRAFLKRNMKIGEKITVIGKINKNKSILTASEIRFEKLEEEPKIEPIYHSTYGLSLKKIASLISNIDIESLKIEDYIPNMYKEKYQFLEKKESIKLLHFPSTIPLLQKARLRTKYEELFVFMMKMNYLKNNIDFKEGIKRKIDFKEVEKQIKKLPFTLTVDQNKSIEEIYKDLSTSKRMNRLLQGDVGSGKTIVAFLAIYMNFLSGYQSAMMAPTEILARQHFENMKKLFQSTKMNIVLLTGKTKVKEKREIYKNIENGKIDVIIGTHALISEKLTYKNVGLVVTDEQHRFGVMQRANLKNKGTMADILYMSATPIPRTYALTLYGDMDISNIYTRPKGRKEVRTKVVNEKQIKFVLEAMYRELEKGHQIYVIAPLIEESEKVSFENAENLYKKMNLAFGKKYKIGLLHGKMPKEEKEKTMEEYTTNEIQILISTTVIEVGIDVENATMIVIFDAFRFGLSTLHQLRGRVGRNELQSYCILISSSQTERLKIMEKTNNGFEISEEDFQLRGSGDLFGTKQSGDMKFMIADIKKDFKILMQAKIDSEEYLKKEEGKRYMESLVQKINQLD